MNTITFTKTEPPEWLLAMWKEIDDKTFGKGFDCFAVDAVCNLGVQFFVKRRGGITFAAAPHGMSPPSASSMTNPASSLIPSPCESSRMKPTPRKWF